MHFKHENRYMVDILFVIALFGTFAISALVVVTIGASVYQRTVNDMNYNFNSRTSFAYITEKLQQVAGEDDVAIDTFGDGDALVLKQDFNGEEYETYLYQNKGFLKELFVKKSEVSSVGPEAGQEIIALKNMQIQTISKNLYCFTLTNNSNIKTTLYLSTKSQQ